MAIATYADLQAAVANWIDRTDLTARIPEFVALCEAQMFRKLRVTRMIQRDTATIDQTNRYSTVPANYLETIAYSLSDGTTSWQLEPSTVEQIADFRANNDQPSKPRVYAQSGTAFGREFEHYPTPDRAYTGTLVFYGKPNALGSSIGSPPVVVTTNWILDEAPDAYLYGTLLQAAPYLRDTQQAQVWADGFSSALDDLRANDRTKAPILRTELPGLAIRTSYDITRG